jgi:peptidoglycan/LPS O-acetylase OafA/YrhL
MRLPRFSALRPQTGELLHLDLLRFIAASGIVLHHSQRFFFRDNQIEAWRQASGLALFVDLFFAISGYIIAHVYANRTATAGQFAGFMQRRIARLAPLHWLTMAAAMAVWLLFLRFGFLHLGVLKLGAYTESMPSLSPRCLAETAVLVQAAIPCGGDAFNGISWSINAEMAMYVAFPLFAAAGHFRRALPLLLGLAVLAVALAAIRFGFGSVSIESWTSYSVHPYLRALPSFLIGVGLWFLREPLKRIPAPRTLLLFAVPALLASMVTGQGTPLVLFLTYLAAALAVSADLVGSPHRIVKLIAPLGQLTYSIYMWHALFILLALTAINQYLPHASSLEMSILALLTYAGIVGWSYLSFTVVETPARRWLDSLPPFGRRHSANGGVVAKPRLLEIEGAQIGEDVPGLFDDLLMAVKPGSSHSSHWAGNRGPWKPESSVLKASTISATSAATPPPPAAPSGPDSSIARPTTARRPTPT